MALTMPVQFRKRWRDLQHGRPGHRFQSRYEQVRQVERRPGVGRRILIIAFAMVLIAIGAVLLVIPGPGILFLLMGGGMLATESRSVARFMDWSEIHGRKMAARVSRRWKRRR